MWLSRVSLKRFFRYWRWRLHILGKRLWFLFGPILEACGLYAVVFGWAMMGFLILALACMIIHLISR